MAKYTKEEKQKAIDLYIRYCRQATKAIKELGYPNERHHWSAGTGDMKRKVKKLNQILKKNEKFVRMHHHP